MRWQRSGQFVRSGITSLFARLYALSVSPTHIGISAVLSLRRSPCEEEANNERGRHVSVCVPLLFPSSVALDRRRHVHADRREEDR